jgi:hypothetical protein
LGVRRDFSEYLYISFIKVDKYDVENDLWSDEGQFPELTQFRVAHGAVATADGLLYVMGGSAKASEDFGPGLDEMEALRTEKSESGDLKIVSPWSRLSSMSVGRSYLSSAEIDGQIYVVSFFARVATFCLNL